MAVRKRNVQRSVTGPVTVVFDDGSSESLTAQVDLIQVRETHVFPLLHGTEQQVETWEEWRVSPSEPSKAKMLKAKAASPGVQKVVLAWDGGLREVVVKEINEQPTGIVFTEEKG